MDSCWKFHRTSLPDGESFHSNLNIEDIGEPDYEHGDNVWTIFEIKFQVITVTFMSKVIVFLLMNMFENFRETF